VGFFGVTEEKWIAALPQRSGEFAGRGIIRSLNREKVGPGDLQTISRHRSPAQSWSPPMWVLLLLPFIGLLWVPFYNFEEPALFGFPFFYWYQLAWVPITALLIWLVYRKRTPDETP
jgi:hypothetical protein